MSIKPLLALCLLFASLTVQAESEKEKEMWETMTKHAVRLDLNDFRIQNSKNEIAMLLDLGL